MPDNAEFMAELLDREPKPDPLRTALVAIQELHVPALGWGVPLRCGHCCYEHPCPSRRLADDALTTRTTKNGDNK